jgi:hypothetical protein
MSARQISERVADLAQLLANERRIAEGWLTALDAMRVNRQLPPYFLQTLYPHAHEFPQGDAWRTATSLTDRVLLGDRVRPPFPYLGCDVRWSEPDRYYVRNHTGATVYEGTPSELLCVHGLADCLTPRQLTFLAAGLKSEAHKLRESNGGAA